jgi:outer membrane protein
MSVKNLLLPALALTAIISSSPARAEQTPVQDLLSIYQKALEQDPVWASSQSANLAAQEKLEQGKALYRPTITLNSEFSEPIWSET